MSKETLARNLRALSKQPGTFHESGLQPSKALLTSAALVGVGKAANKTSSANTFTEVCKVYSKVVVQEDGVFEAPTRWPEENTYDGYSFADEDLPVMGEPYVLQRRVHAYVYKDNTGAYEAHHILTDLAQPFSVAGHPPEPLDFPLAQGKFQPVMTVFLATGVTADTSTAIANVIKDYAPV